MDTTAKIPLSERINLRVVLFAGIVLFLFGWPVYAFLAETASKGVIDHGSYKEVDLKAMGFFQMDPKTATLKDVPAAYRALDGQRVLLQGQIDAPREAGSNITEFTLLYCRRQCCCFLVVPKVQERVFVTVNPAFQLRYADDIRYEVMGTLHVTMKRDDYSGEVVEVYHLDADSIKPLNSLESTYCYH